MKKIIDIFKQKKIIIVLFVLVISIISIVIIVTKNNNIIIRIGRQVEREEVIQDDISYTIYDNTTDKIKTLLTVQRIDGIDSIEYLNNEDENIKIDCKGKKKVSVDMYLDLNKEYPIKVISNGQETTKTILLDDNYLDDYIKIIESSEDETGNKKIVIETDKNLETQKTYYKIGENSNWNEYTKELDGSAGLGNLIDILENDILNVKIYGKKEDEGGNIVLTNKDYAIDTRKSYKEVFNVFQDIKNAGATLQDYGFSASFNGAQWEGFQIGTFGASHWTDHASYSGVFKMDVASLGKMKATSLFIQGNIDVTGSAWARISATVYYTDGTSQTSETISSTRGFTTNLEEKEIDYIQFNIWRL